MQDVSLDISGDLKELYGQNQFPDDVARGKHKITGKAKFGRINGLLLNQLFFGQSASTGMKSFSIDEEGAVPGTPYQVTVAQSAQFVEDLGVRYKATGASLTKVSSSPAVGQYSEAAGVYTFAAGDTGAAVMVSYTYNSASAGTTISVVNHAMGFAPQFEVLLVEQYNGSQFGLRLYACKSSKLSIATKGEDYTVPELDFTAFANSSGQVLDVYTQE